MSNACPITGEWREGRLAWREDFINAYLCQKAGLLLVGAPTFDQGLVLNGTSQYATYEGEKSRNIFSASSMYLFVRFTPDFDYDDGSAHYFLDSAPNNRIRLIKTAGDDLELRVGGTLIATILPGTYAAWWNTGEENVLTISYSSGDSNAWLNGVPILINDPSAWAPDYDEATLYIGADSAGANFFDGTIHEVLIGIDTVDEDEDSDYRAGTTISALDEAQSVITIPCIGSYVRASDGLQVTPAIGLSGVREVLMGSDGATAAEFPTALWPRGFYFDGGDQLNVGDDDAFTFASGGSDLPFSLSLMGKVNDYGGGAAYITKVSDPTVGEYYFIVNGVGRLQMRYVDDSVGVFRGRRSIASAVMLGLYHIVAITYSGEGDPSLPQQAKPYVDSTEQNDSDSSNPGVYTSMENTDEDLLIGAAIPGYSVDIDAYLFVPSIRNIDMTQIQVRANRGRVTRQVTC